jgi:hypothetical protein
MLVVPLSDEVDPDDLLAFVRDLGSGSLLFLRTVRRLVWSELVTGELLVNVAKSV